MFSSFMLNAWFAGSIVAVVAGVVGYFVVLRGATFAAHALPLGTFPGAAAAGFLGVNPLWGLVVFAGLGVAGISRLGRRQRADVATALTLIALLGLGTLFLSLSGQYAAGVYGLLFGEVLGVSRADLVPVGGLGLVCVVVTLALYRPLLLSAVSADLAGAGYRLPGWLNLAFLGLLGLATAMALPVVGALLVFSLMTGPPALARALTARPVMALGLSVALALATIWAAIALSYQSNWPVGFFVGLLAAVGYVAGRVWRVVAGRGATAAAYRFG